MSILSRHVVAVVAALFALAVGIALGGGPLSYVPASDGSDDVSTATDDPGAEPADEGGGDAAGDGSGDGGYADAFAEAAAARLYDERLLGHPTAVLAMPGAEPETIEGLVAQVGQAGGGLTGGFALTDAVTDLGETTAIDELGRELVSQLDDERIDPTAPAYVRFGQLVGLAISTPVKDGGQRAHDSALAIRQTLADAELMSSTDAQARLAPLVLVVLPPDDPDDDDLLAQAGVYRGLVIGLTENAAGVVVVGDTDSAEDGLLAELREDSEVRTVASTVGGGEGGLGLVTAMLALIDSLEGTVGSFGASGEDGVPPLS